ncbi:MAG: hypothetical protein JNL42_11525 [Anaerolineae bacterium]|nr:hypothetical protein [Anaerolineae bacterium]
MATSDPPVTRLLRGVTAVEVLVLIVSGGGLFFLPTLLGPLWPWALAPFNTRFLGGVYLASMVSAAALAYVGRWGVARLIVPMIFVFTAIVLGVSVGYADRFTQSPLSTLAWFVLYVGIPLNALYHLWIYRKMLPVPGAPLPSWLRILLGAQVLALGGYGVLLFAAPGTASGFWPWALDDFHARMYSVAFITPALGAWLLLRSASAPELRALGFTQIVGGLPIVGLIIVDSVVQRVSWSAAGTWLWIVLFGAVFGMGMTLLWQARARR